MYYIKDCDYEYIITKYKVKGVVRQHNSNRFVRKDDIFSPDTGMDGDKIKEEILLRDKENEHLQHSVRKALAFDFILKNTRISCDNRDIFPAINSIDRPLNSTLFQKWIDEVFGEIIPEIEKKKRSI